ncbi:MAG: hypothetical protein A3K10_03210, partial [Bacteroidetes bacterium RIFCSPLOWO2_12_FULL_31_6]
MLKQEKRIEEINLLDLYDRFSESKKIFIITSVAFIVFGFLITAYIWPTYIVKSDVQIQTPESVGEQTSDIIYGANKKTTSNHAVDEAVALRSFPNMLKAMDSLGFDVSYYVDNIFGDEEIYKATQFKIELDKKGSAYIPYSEKFSIKVLPDSKYHIKGEYENEDDDKDYKFETIIGANEWASVKTFRFRILPVAVTEYYSRPDSAKESILFAFTDVANELVFECDEELTVTPKDTKESAVLEINLNTSVPNKAIDLVNLMVNQYINESLEKRNSLAVNSIKYIDEELKNVNDSLNLAETRLQEFQVENKIADVSDEGQRISEKIEKLESEKSELVVKSRYYLYLQQYFQDSNNSEKLVSTSSFGISDEVINAITKDLSDLQSDKMQLMAEGKTKNPIYNSTCNKIESLKATLKTNVENFNTSNNILLNNVEKRLGEANALILKLPVSERMIVKIQRDATLSSDLYNLLQQKKAQAQTMLQATSPSSRVVDPAHLLSVDPKFPMWLVYPIMLVLAFLMVISCVLIGDFLSKKVINMKLVTNTLSLQHIGNIPSTAKNFNPSQIALNPQHEVSEAARLVLYNASNFNGRNNKIILVTSAVKGEGKSFCASSLAMVSTFAKKRTLLICADFRTPSIQDTFKLDLSPGLTDYIQGNCGLENIIRKSSNSNIDIVTSGTEANNPGALPENQAINDLLEYARANYDKIIIDTT